MCLTSSNAPLCANLVSTSSEAANISDFFFQSITAFMFICGRSNAINIQPISPFSGNFLHEVANFENPETHVNSILEARESMDEEEDDEKCPKCPNNDCTKRELEKVGSIVADHFLENDRRYRETDEVEDSIEREFKEEQEKYANETEQMKQLYEKIENSSTTNSSAENSSDENCNKCEDFVMKTNLKKQRNERNFCFFLVQNFLF